MGDGRWDAAYAPQSTIEVPDDLAAALAAAPAASALFATLDGQNRFAILFRIGNVKRAETRARKIAEYVAMLERGETIYPRKP
ncbi:YdeI/OmpD-associated family protein [Leifsonia sp. A12D58]|uniref:YdeI/OmpD-associated family protein n=1 Tax=Leifsonia sp. A12D58 TaxID=3397674 RepID=UPI0039DF8BAE